VCVCGIIDECCTHTPHILFQVVQLTEKEKKFFLCLSMGNNWLRQTNNTNDANRDENNIRIDKCTENDATSLDKKHVPCRERARARARRGPVPMLLFVDRQDREESQGR
jgi:hypothetical protein